MMKKLITILAAIIMFFCLVGIALSMNMWMSYTIFEDINVVAGFQGLYKVEFCDGCFNQYMIEWGTHDENITYLMTVTAEGEGGRFFKEYAKKPVEINNETKYHYDVFLKIPKNTKAGIYPYTLCGRICNSQAINICLELCKSGNVIVNGSKV